MAKTNKIWIGPGVLRASSDFKGERKVLPGHEIPKGFVSSERLKQLEDRGKVCSESAYTKSQAASGVVPVIDAAGKIKALEVNVKIFEDAGKKLAEENKKLTEALAASTSDAAAIKIEELEANVEGLEKANTALTEGVALSAEEADNKIKALEGEVIGLKEALKEATKKGSK